VEEEEEEEEEEEGEMLERKAIKARKSSHTISPREVDSKSQKRSKKNQTTRPYIRG